jgi:DNA-directed RNA polymerase specialized sigma24 family protein
MPEPRQADVFPATMVSWIDERLGTGPNGRLEVNRHIMGVYNWPLRVYFMGTRDRWLGEPEDVVQGFFASRLAKEDFLSQWRASGMKLRHWLINAFCFYLKEMHRARRRDARHVAQADEPAVEHKPSATFDRAYVVSVVREALRRTQEVCEREKLTQHWEIFLRHFYQGQAYADFAREFGVDAARAAVMARTARTKFQATLRAMLARDGTGQDPDDEIRDLLEGDG